MIVDRTYKEGIDKQIAKLQTYMHDKLITTWGIDTNVYQCYPRCYRNQTSDGYIPQVKLPTSNEYKVVTLDDRLSVSSFFGIGTRSDMDVSLKTPVHVVFFTNLDKIKPGAERRDEEARLDVMKILELHMYGFNLVRVVTGIKEVMEGYEGYRIDEGLKFRDMHPFHCFRFDMEIIFNPTLCY